MDHDTFRETFEEMGFEISEEWNGEDEPVLIAVNRNGGRVWWSINPDTDDWGLYVDPDGPTLDDPMFEAEDVEFSDGGALVIGSASGTCSADQGHGRRSFDGEFRLDVEGVTITETTEHRL